MNRLATIVRRTWGPPFFGLGIAALLVTIWATALAPRFPEDTRRIRFRPIRTFWYEDQVRPRRNVHRVRTSSDIGLRGSELDEAVAPE